MKLGFQVFGFMVASSSLAFGGFMSSSFQPSESCCVDAWESWFQGWSKLGVSENRGTLM